MDLTRRGIMDLARRGGHGPSQERGGGGGGVGHGQTPNSLVVQFFSDAVSCQYCEQQLYRTGLHLTPLGSLHSC